MKHLLTINLKLSLAILLFLTFLSKFTFAQTSRNDPNSRFSVGIIGGINFAGIRSSDGSGFKYGNKTGFSLGVSFDIPIIYPLSIEPQILYSQKGFSSTSAAGKFTQRNDFLEIPVFLKVHVLPGVSVMAGPQLSTLLSTTNKFDDGFNQTTQQYYADRRYNKTLIGGAAGISIDLVDNLQVWGRYSTDFKEVKKNGDTFTPQFKNRLWQVGLGFKF